MNGMASNDTLLGLDGKDTLIGGGGADDLDGGDDGDLLVALGGLFEDDGDDRLIGGGGFNFGLLDPEDEHDLLQRRFGRLEEFLGTA